LVGSCLDDAFPVAVGLLLPDFHDLSTIRRVSEIRFRLLAEYRQIYFTHAGRDLNLLGLPRLLRAPSTLKLAGFCRGGTSWKVLSGLRIREAGR
jgi:hypothetical protein